MSECPDDNTRILVKIYRDNNVLIERVIGELLEVR